jgi:hypothetical protein
MLIGVGSRRRSASQAIDLPSDGGGNLGRLIYTYCSGFRMRVSAAPFAGHASGGPPAAAHVREAELRGGHLGHAAEADDLQLKVFGNLLKSLLRI